MQFNSIEYLIFLPVVFICYWYVFRSLRWQNAFVVFVSYIFYGWWNWNFLILIAITSLCSFVSGLLIGSSHSNQKQKEAKLYCIANITVNLLILGIYKYYNFFVDSTVTLLSTLGVDAHPASLQLILPIGISFYTFQALSYTIDVYKGKILPTKDPISFFAFLSFFPQLVAGPIERATNLLPQFQKKRNFDYNKAVDGMRQILWGLFKKIVVADNCATACNHVFDNYGHLGSIALIWGAVLFTFQIYGDFSGYSDIAIGTARLFGINLKRNFHFPYFSRNVAEFWKRWHISLNTWFVDYIYIPLGGSRCAKWKVIRNTFVIFLLSGLWHGANWTYICWGAYHALLFVPLLLMNKTKTYKGVVADKSFLPSINEGINILGTFVLVVIGWIIFRAENVRQASDYLYRIITEYRNIDFSTVAMPGKSYIAYIFILLAVEWLQRKKEFGLQLNDKFIPRPVRFCIYYALILFIIYAGGEETQFIYFQF